MIDAKDYRGEKGTPIIMMRFLVALSVTLALAGAACGGGEGQPGAGGGPRDERPQSGGEPAGRIAFVSFRDGNQEIYVINADGTGERNLTEDPSEDFDPDWSPDGTKITFVSNRTGQPRIYVMDADGSNVQQLTSGAVGGLSPRWSRDGERIAYSRAGGIALINVDGSDMQLIMEAEPDETAAPCKAGSFPGGWSPDDELITYYAASATRGIGQVCTIKADGSDVEVIVEGPDAYFVEPVFSPVGSEIAYRAIVDGQHDIWVVDLETGEQMNLTDDPDLDIEPSWSPDGEWIAFGSLRPQEPHFDLFIMRRDGTGVQRLTDDPAKEANPVWAP